MSTGRPTEGAWCSPSGTETSPKLAIARPDGTGLTVLPQAEGIFEDQASLTPDGQRSTSSGTRRRPTPLNEPAMALFTADPDGHHITHFRPFTTDQRIKADWAPDGRRIAVTENANLFNPDYSANIVTMRPDGTNVRHLTAFHDQDTRAYLGSYPPMAAGSCSGSKTTGCSRPAGSALVPLGLFAEHRAFLVGKVAGALVWGEPSTEQ